MLVKHNSEQYLKKISKIMSNYIGIAEWVSEMY